MSLIYDEKGNVFAEGPNAEYVSYPYVVEPDYTKWLEKWQDNYYGRTPEAKELESFMKNNYGGQSYIPWATMVRLLYKQDPSAKLVVVKSDNGHLHQSDYVIRNVINGVETIADVFVNHVVVTCTFMGVYHEEIYPVQGLRYDAPKAVDQNMVNKAIQRAKAKVISLATGLAFSLYETGDLQFEEATDEKAEAAAKVKGDLVKAEKAVEATKKPQDKPKRAKPEPSEKPKEALPEGVKDPSVYALAEFVFNNMDALEKGLLTLNKIFITKYKFAVSPDDDLTTLLDKFAVLPEPDTTLRVAKKMARDAGKEV